MAPRISFSEEDKKGGNPKAFFLFLGLSLVMGIIGAVLAVVAFTASPNSLLAKLGLNRVLNLETTRTEHVILEESSAVIDATKKISPAVVSIVSTRDVVDFFGRTLEQKGGGTGFIITSDGLILTNRHVVEDTTAEYTVFTSDGRDFKATVLARDTVLDLAVLRINTTSLSVVELGDSDQLEVGQWVIAIGNALGEFRNTVTVGVLSAKERQITASGTASGSETLEGLLQTDAAINPGNSGGPLVNLKGQVIGINTAVAGGAQGIGFAIPINAAKLVIESVKKTGKIVRPMLGVRAIAITKELAKANNLSVDYGALILRGSSPTDLAIVPGGPADKAGIAENDIILEVNGERVDENHSLTRLIQQYSVGQEIELKILHKGQEEKLKVTLGEQS